MNFSSLPLDLCLHLGLFLSFAESTKAKPACSLFNTFLCKRTARSRSVTHTFCESFSDDLSNLTRNQFAHVIHQCAQNITSLTLYDYFILMTPFYLAFRFPSLTSLTIHKEEFMLNINPDLNFTNTVHGTSALVVPKRLGYLKQDPDLTNATFANLQKVSFKNLSFRYLHRFLSTSPIREMTLLNVKLLTPWRDLKGLTLPTLSKLEIDSETAELVLRCVSFPNLRRLAIHTNLASKIDDIMCAHEMGWDKFNTPNTLLCEHLSNQMPNLLETLNKLASHFLRDTNDGHVTFLGVENFGELVCDHSVIGGDYCENLLCHGIQNCNDVTVSNPLKSERWQFD